MSVDEIRARWAGVVWQRSKFVDGPRYADKPPEWKQAMQNIEQHIIRGPGAVGSPSCNMVMAVHDFDDATTPERVAAAPADIRTLLAAYGAAIAERDKYKAMCLGETYGDLDELRADVLRLVKDHVTLTAERDALKARVEELRPEVRAFAALMERELRENDWKGGWKGCDVSYLRDRLAQEYAEAILAADYYQSYGTMQERVASEAADVANIAMMLCDVLGQLAQTPQLEREVKGGDIGKEPRA